MAVGVPLEKKRGGWGVEQMQHGADDGHTVFLSSFILNGRLDSGLISIYICYYSMIANMNHA